MKSTRAMGVSLGPCSKIQEARRAVSFDCRACHANECLRAELPFPVATSEAACGHEPVERHFRPEALTSMQAPVLVTDLLAQHCRAQDQAWMRELQMLSTATRK